MILVFIRTPRSPELAAALGLIEGGLLAGVAGALLSWMGWI